MKEDGEEKAIRARALLHYNKHMCDHEACKIPDAHELAYSFQRKTEEERFFSIRCMIFSLAPPAQPDDVAAGPAGPANKTSKRPRSKAAATASSSFYAMRGRKICRDAFLAIVQVSSDKLDELVREVTSQPIPTDLQGMLWGKKGKH